MSTKRKRTVLSIVEKLEIIKKLEQGETAAKLALDFGIGVQTVRDIKKCKEKLIESACRADSGAGPSNRKTLKTSNFADVDDALYLWFKQKRAEGVPISGPLLMEKAKEFHAMLNIKEEFSASSGWLSRFKKRHGIREISVQGEKLSANTEAAATFSTEFSEFIDQHDLSPHQIYNADETGLYWKGLPTRSLVFKAESNAPGYKMCKDRLTVLFCANSTGNHKLKPLVIGKSKSPRALKGRQHLPVHYTHQKGAWMNSEIFADWFHTKFVPSVRIFLEGQGLPAKAVLLLDNAPCHPEATKLASSDGKIFVKYLPPHVTSLIQPLDQGVIASFKQYYRGNLLRQMIDEATDVLVFWKTINVLDAIHGIQKAWDSVKVSTLQNAWKKILPQPLQHDFKGFEEEGSNTATSFSSMVKNVVGFEDVDECNISEWLSSDDHEQGFQHLNEEAIVTKVRAQEEEANESDETDDEHEASVTHTQAVEHVEKLLEYASQNGLDYVDILTLRKIRCAINKNINSVAKQKKIEDFFKKGTD